MSAAANHNFELVRPKNDPNFPEIGSYVHIVASQTTKPSNAGWNHKAPLIGQIWLKATAKQMLKQLPG